MWVLLNSGFLAAQSPENKTPSVVAGTQAVKPSLVGRGIIAPRVRGIEKGPPAMPAAPV
jgi:hypothetical protein